MSDDNRTGAEAGISTRTMDIAVALILFALGALVVFDSLRLGAGWSDDGPQSGYFPFYIGALLCLSSVATLLRIALIRMKRRDQFAGAIAEMRGLFVAWGPLRQVFAVLLPAALYVLLVQLIGIYVASTLYIAVFMVWIGKYTWLRSVTVGLVVSVSLYLMFEVWFKVPLFKGAWNPLGWLPY
jgi:hypothetical protein